MFSTFSRTFFNGDALSHAKLYLLIFFYGGLSVEPVSIVCVLYAIVKGISVEMRIKYIFYI
jgi:hypothetical protein